MESGNEMSRDTNAGRSESPQTCWNQINVLDLTGVGCSSPRDVVLRRVLNPDLTIQKAHSTPDMTRTDVSGTVLDRDIPVEIMKVMRRLSQLDLTGDREIHRQDSGSEESFIVWSDDNSSVTSSLSLTPTECKQNKISEELKVKDKAYHVAMELTNTEQIYVEKLEILQKARHKAEHILGSDIARQMFPNINSMYTLHRDNLLPHLRSRLSSWTSKPNLGDIMKMFAPYLKIYTDYVKNFHGALEAIETWNAKSTQFSNMLRSLSTHPRKKETFDLKLDIKAHMLEPIQRLPRYELLLQQYCKEIPADCTEYDHVQEALESITQATMHFEDMIKHDTQMMELVDIQRQIDCPFNLVSSSRYLVKQGKIGKVEATTGKVVNRYIFLFNDLFLLCSESVYLPFSVYKYRVRHLAEIDGIQVEDGNSLDVPHTFYVKTKKKVIELCARDNTEKDEWIKCIWQVIGERMRNKLSKADQTTLRRTMMLCSEGSLGKVPPSWVHNSQVSMCMLCAADFKPFRRKHHCRSCGMVVCRNCSSHTAKLEYDDFKENRVCDECYLLLGENSHIIKQHSTYKKQTDTCVYRGYLEVSTDHGRTWRRRWFEVHSDHRLSCYKAQQDIRPVSEMELSSCTIEMCALSSSPGKLIQIQTGSRKYLLRPEQTDCLSQWVDALRTLSVRT